MIKQSSLVTWWSYRVKMVKNQFKRFHCFDSLAQPRDERGLFYHFYIKVICSYLINRLTMILIIVT